MSPIEIEYQRDFGKAVVLLYLKDHKKPSTVILNNQDVATLYHNIKEVYDASQGKIKKQAFDVVNGIKPKVESKNEKEQGDADDVIISGKLYREYKNLFVKNQKLNRDNRLLKQKIRLLKERIALMKDKEQD